MSLASSYLSIASLYLYKGESRLQIAIGGKSEGKETHQVVLP